MHNKRLILKYLKYLDCQTVLESLHIEYSLWIETNGGYGSVSKLQVREGNFSFSFISHGNGKKRICQWLPCITMNDAGKTAC